MALQAEAPYLKALGDYTSAKMAYASTAQGYEARSQADLLMARDLFGYARQYQLEGDHASEANFDHQSEQLYSQAKGFRGTAEGYIAKARSLEKAFRQSRAWPKLQGAMQHGRKIL